MDPLRVAVVQGHATDDHGACMAAMSQACAAAATRGATLVVLPENYAGIASARARRAWALHPGAPHAASATAPLCEASAATGTWIVAGGTQELAEDGRMFNTALVIGNGRVCARYRKLHLFDADVPGQPALRESADVAPGDGAVVVRTPGAMLGLSICYDLRFAALYRGLAAAGAELLAVPAAFTHPTGEAHWEVLLRARAIETQCFVLAAAQYGDHGGGRRSWGHSMIVDPWGRILAEADESDAFVVADLDPEALALARRRVPCGEHHVATERLQVRVVDPDHVEG